MFNRRKCIRLVISTILFVFVLGYSPIVHLIVPGAEAASPSPKILKVGFTGALSGPAAQWGQAFHNVVKLDFDRVNDKGGLMVGGEKYIIKLIAEDDRLLADLARANTEKLVFRDEVKFIIGSHTGSTVLAQQIITEPNKVLVVCNGAGPSLNAKTQYTFRIWTPILERLIATFGMLKAVEPNLRRVATITTNDESGWETINYLDPTFRLYGYEVAYNAVHEREVTDFYPLVLKVLGSKPDIINLASPPGSQMLQIKQLTELGWKGKMITLIPIVGEVLAKTLGNEPASRLYTSNYSFEPPLATPELAKAKKDYLAKYGEFNPNCSIYVDGGPFFVKGILEANSLDTTKVRDAMETMKYTSILGECVLGGKEIYGINHQLMTPICISKIVDGKDIPIKVISGREVNKMVIEVMTLKKR
jgi:branched-chain amino acid transport system substrate-binding protein